MIMVALILELLKIKQPKINNMKKFTLLTAVFCALLLSSCATLFCGTTEKITFDSDINQSATLTIDGRKHKNVVFPYTTKIYRGLNSTIVKAESEGYETTILYIDKKFNWVSILNCYDVLGWAVDIATGAVTTAEYDYYPIEFEKSEAIE